MQNDRNYIKNDQGLDIFTIPDFLSDEECDHICSLIEQNNTRSSVTAEGTKSTQYHDGRTSNTSNLSDNDDIVNRVNLKMYNELNISKEYSEPTQGQIYQVGQEFRHHNDFFTDGSYTNHCLSSGQRTYTFMIYLNDVEEGGETDFPKINQTFTPQKRMAVVWKNSDGTGKENYASHHAGKPVIKGKKIIITKWFRENEYNSSEDFRLAQLKHKESKHINTFSSKEQLPKLTPLGFKVVKVPELTWRLIKEAYNLLQNVKTKENWAGIENFIHDENGVAQVEIFNMDNCHRIKEIIQEELKPIHEDFAGQPIEKVWIYGIRSYLRGSILEDHTDRVETHHVSSIIIVDKKVDEDWALDVQDHNGEWHKIYAEVGDMILYESAICKHGRKEPLNGDFYRNFYAHYKLLNYTFK